MEDMVTREVARHRCRDRGVPPARRADGPGNDAALVE
jgi:hypothetical protein